MTSLTHSRTFHRLWYKEGRDRWSGESPCSRNTRLLGQAASRRREGGRVSGKGLVRWPQCDQPEGHS